MQLGCQQDAAEMPTGCSRDANRMQRVHKTSRFMQFCKPKCTILVSALTLWFCTLSVHYWPLIVFCKQKLTINKNPKRPIFLKKTHATHTLTKQTAPPGTNTACRKKHRDKTNRPAKTHATPPMTKQTAPPETNTVCRKKHRDKPNGLHGHKPIRTTKTAAYNCPWGKPTRPQKKQPCTNPEPLAKTNTATNQTACTAAKRPEPQTQPRTTATGGNPPHDKPTRPARTQHRLQKPAP